MAAAAAALFKVLLFDITIAVESYQRASEGQLILYQRLFAENTEAMAITDPAWRFERVNPTFETLIGLDQGECAAERLHGILAAGQEEAVDKLFVQLAETGIFRGEMRLKRREGASFPAWVNLSAVRDAGGAVTHNLVEFSDVTDYRRSQDELAYRTVELKRSNAELEQFAYVASHDLQEPLRMVASYTQLLARRYKGKMDVDADEFIGYAVEGAQRMQVLINDLLAYSRVGSKGRELGPVSLEAVLQRALLNLKLAIADEGAEVTHDPLPMLMGDEVQLLQLLQNLLANAIKFRGQAAPRIHVGVREAREGWAISVQDNGIGIAPQFFERIFVIFQRLHKRSEYAGTGIGLAICRKIVERHGGRIWVESVPGEGTTFRFTLSRNAASG
jgi:PAS domain S-box-containing protein